MKSKKDTETTSWGPSLKSNLLLPVQQTLSQNVMRIHPRFEKSHWQTDITSLLRRGTARRPMSPGVVCHQL